PDRPNTSEDGEAIVLPTLREGAELRTVLGAAGTIRLRGGELDPRRLPGGEAARRLEQPATPWHGGSYWFTEPDRPPEQPARTAVPGLGWRLGGPIPTYEIDAAATPSAFSGPGGLVDAAIAAARDHAGGIWPHVTDLEF